VSVRGVVDLIVAEGGSDAAAPNDGLVGGRRDGRGAPSHPTVAAGSFNLHLAARPARLALSLSLDVERAADRSQGTSETVRVLLGGHTTMLAASLQAGESPDRGQRARWGGWLDFSEYRGRHQYISWTRREHPACPIDLCGGCSTSRVD
jgi:hypothetical protein